jgi:hypothetical protein
MTTLLQRMGVLKEPGFPSIEAQSQVWKARKGREREKSSALSPLFARALEKVQQESGTALIFEAGNKREEVFHLVKKGWEVIAVDSFSQAFSGFQPTTRLSLVHARMEVYEFPKEVQFISGIDAFSFCDPAKFKQVWERAHASLASGGILVADFFPRSQSSGLERIYQICGGWLATVEDIEAILCQYRERSCSRIAYEAQIGMTFGTYHRIECIAQKA